MYNDLQILIQTPFLKWYAQCNQIL